MHPSSSNKKRKKASVGEIPFKELPSVEGPLRKILRDVSDIAVTQDGEKVDIEEVENLRNGIDQIIKNVETLEDLCRSPENQGFNVQVCVSITWLFVCKSLIDSPFSTVHLLLQYQSRYLVEEDGGQYNWD